MPYHNARFQDKRIPLKSCGGAFSGHLANLPTWAADGGWIDADPATAPFSRRLGARDVGVAPSGSIAGRMLPRLVLDV
jgi:hypothetical protein